MKNVFAALVLFIHLAGSAWLWIVEGWVSAVAFFLIFAIVSGTLLNLHDAVSGIFRPRSR